MGGLYLYPIFCLNSNLYICFKGGVYLLIHFLGNFREKTKKVPTHSLFRKLSEISPKFPKKLEALLLVTQLGKGNFFDSCKFPKAL